MMQVMHRSMLSFAWAAISVAWIPMLLGVVVCAVLATIWPMSPRAVLPGVRDLIWASEPSPDGSALWVSLITDPLLTDQIYRHELIDTSTGESRVLAADVDAGLLAFSEDGQRLWTVLAPDGGGEIWAQWDIASGARESRVIHRRPGPKFAVFPDRIRNSFFMFGPGPAAWMIDESWQPFDDVGVFDCFTAREVAFFPKASLYAVGNSSGRIVVGDETRVWLWDIAERREIWQVTGADRLPFSSLSSRLGLDQETVVVVRQLDRSRHEIDVWNPRTGAKKTIASEGHLVYPNHLSRNCRWLLVDEYADVPRHADWWRKPLIAIGWMAKNDEELATPSTEFRTRLFDLKTNRQVRSFPEIGSVSMSRDGDTLAVIPKDGPIEIYDMPPRPSRMPILLGAGAAVAAWLIAAGRAALRRPRAHSSSGDDACARP